MIPVGFGQQQQQGPRVPKMLEGGRPPNTGTPPNKTASLTTSLEPCPPGDDLPPLPPGPPPPLPDSSPSSTSSSSQASPTKQQNMGNVPFYQQQQPLLATPAGKILYQFLRKVFELISTVPFHCNS